ncbi:hypothetical protein GCM10020001_095660 [Nonomuraea salmonea]
MHVVAEAGDELAFLAAGPHGAQGEGVPAGVVGGQRVAVLLDDVVQEAAAVLGDAEEARAAAEQPRRQRPLDGVGRRQVRQPRHDRGRREPVVGQRGQHRLEDAYLAGRRAALGGQPERQLAEAHLAHDVAGQILSEQGDRLQ